MTTAIWWVRRDLRLFDNLALHTALDRAAQVIPVFVLDPLLLESDYTGEKRRAFLFGGLRALGPVVERPNTYGAGTGVTYNSEHLKLVWERLVTEAGVRVLLHAFLAQTHVAYAPTVTALHRQRVAQGQRGRQRDARPGSDGAERDDEPLARVSRDVQVDGDTRGLLESLACPLDGRDHFLAQVRLLRSAAHEGVDLRRMHAARRLIHQHRQ